MTYFDTCFDKLIAHEGSLSFCVAPSWLKQIAFWNPSFYSSVNSANRYSDNFASVLKQKFFAAKSNISVCPGIACLISSRGPSAIFFAIVSVVINSVKSVIFWPSPHIRKKVFKLFPSRTVRNSPSSIIFPLWAILVVATSFHRGPNSVLSGRFVIRSLSMSSCFGLGKFSPKTPATYNKPSPESIHSCHASSPAVTHVIPVAMLFISSVDGRCNYSSKPLS